MSELFKTGSGRVWVIKYRAGPTHEPIYYGRSMAAGLDWSLGDITKIEAPDDRNYNRWNEIDSFQGAPDRPGTTLTVYEEDKRSNFQTLVRVGCAFDVQVHQSNCENPTDFDMGWEKILVYEKASATNISTSEVGAIKSDDQAEVTEDLQLSAKDYYEILRMAYTSVAATAVGEVVTSINVCDSITCGECEDEPSDGCQRVFATTNSAASSPGLLPQVIITTDQYGTNDIIERWITSAAIGEEASDAACVGDNFVVVSEDGHEIHYAPIADMITSSETWTGVTTGLVAAKSPTKIWTYSAMRSFISALGGYIYLMKNPEDGVTTLDAGVATTQDLNDIDGWDAENVAAVGQAGAFVYTTNGVNFVAGTPPVGPTDLLCVAYRNEKEIWVGGDDGNAYVTTNYGTTWTTVALKGSPTQVDKIVWASETVGFIAIRTAAPLAKILRSVNGGYSWYVAPESSSQSLPVADYINDLAVCEKEVNKLFAGGLGDNAADGIIIRGSDA